MYYSKTIHLGALVSLPQRKFLVRHVVTPDFTKLSMCDIGVADIPRFVNISLSVRNLKGGHTD